MKTTFTCDICDYETEIKSNYNRHLKSVKHAKKAGEIPQKKVYKCTHDGCDYETTDCSNFRKHQEVHNNRSKVPRGELQGKITQLKGKLKRLDKKIQNTEDKETKGFLKELRSIIVKEHNALVRRVKALPNVEEPVEEPVEKLKKNKKKKPVESDDEIDEIDTMPNTSKDKLITDINALVQRLIDLEIDPSIEFNIPDKLEDYDKQYLDHLRSMIEDVFEPSEQDYLNFLIEETKARKAPKVEELKIPEIDYPVVLHRPDFDIIKKEFDEMYEQNKIKEEKAKKEAKKEEKQIRLNGEAVEFVKEEMKTDFARVMKKRNNEGESNEPKKILKKFMIVKYRLHVIWEHLEHLKDEDEDDFNYEEEMEELERYQQDINLLLYSMDHKKEIKETYDQVKGFYKRMKSELRLDEEITSDDLKSAVDHLL
jgi:hypothetical protein